MKKTIHTYQDSRDLLGANWKTSTYTNDGANCVEVSDVRQTHTSIAVRDSKRPSGPALLIDPAAFSTFVSGVVTGPYEV